MKAPALALLLLLAAAAASAQGSGVVRMLDDGSGEGPAYRFDPTALAAAAGAPLALRNEGLDVHTFSHDAPAEQRAFHTGPVEPGRAVDLPAPTEPGEYPFVCVFHGGMRGVLTVTAAAATTTTPTPSGEEDARTPLAAWLALAALAAVALARRRA